MGSPNKGGIAWQTKMLPSATREALEFLSAQDWLTKSSWYLAGGTALTLYEGHRTSLDLDFFTPKKTFAPGDLLAHFSKEHWKVDVAEETTIFASFNGAKTSFIAYPFFVPKEPLLRYGTIHILQPRDIAVMKIIAVSQRGKKRDFVDLYWYTKNREQLGVVLRRLPVQYPTVAHDYHHILKSLMYFEDAEQDPMPELYFQATWEDIKRYFRTCVPATAKEILGVH